MEQQAALHRASTSCKLEITTLDSEIENDCQDLLLNGITSDSSAMRTVGVSHFVTEQDIRDESEYEEIITNIEQIFNPFGILESITIMVISSSDKPEIESRTSEESSSIEDLAAVIADDGEDGSLDRECVVFITFLQGDAALAAASAINGTSHCIITRYCTLL